MKIITRENLLDNLDFYIKEIVSGKVFVFPTDTIYGIGCDATNSNSIKRIKKAKQREFNKPISFIAPDIEWIKKHYEVQEGHEEYLNRLPGAFTYIFQRRENCPISTQINPEVSQADGIRIPNHWFYHDVISQIQVPFCCTSANISGRVNILSINQIEDEMKPYVDYAIDDGKLPSGAKGSTIIDLSKDNPKILRE